MAVFSLATSTLILFAGMVDDLRTQKVHNLLCICALIIGLVTSFLIQSWHGLQVSGISILAAIFLGLPLYLAKIFGGGDFKLLIAFAASTQAPAVAWVIGLSIIWGAIFGVVHALLKGEGRKLFSNTIGLLSKVSSPSENLHKIPYTVALFFGWISHLSVNIYGSGGIL